MNVIWCGILAASECLFSILLFGRKSYRLSAVRYKTLLVFILPDRISLQMPRKEVRLLFLKRLVTHLSAY